MAEYIEREALIASIESIDWYSVHRGELTAGAKSSEHPLYKASEIYSAIDNAPSADVEPVRHGRWVHSDKHLQFKGNGGEIDMSRYEYGHHNGPVFRVCGVNFCLNRTQDLDETKCYIGQYECSECGYQMEKDNARFCPNCGAKMDGV